MRERPPDDPIYKDDETSSLSLDAWTEPSSQGASLGPAQTASWELANSLMQTLSSQPPADNHAAINRNLMMQQLQSDAARALLASSSPDVTMRAIQLLTGFPAASQQSQHMLPSSATSLSLTHPSPLAQLELPASLPQLSFLPQSPQRQAPTSQETFAWGFPFSSPLTNPPLPAYGAEHTQQEQVAFAPAQTPGRRSVNAHNGASNRSGSQSARSPRQKVGTTSPEGKGHGEQLIPQHRPKRMRIPKREFPEAGGSAGASEPRKTRSPHKRDAAAKSPPKDLAMKPWPSEVMSACGKVGNTPPGSPCAGDGGSSEEDADGSQAPARRSKRRRSGNRRQQLARQSSSLSSSVFRGVSRHRLTQRWEASLWLSGKQLYLGGFESEVDAARGYDIAALACKGHHVPTNFGLASYKDELDRLGDCSNEEIVAHVRRSSSAFSRGRSVYRGVSGQDNRWEARIGTFDSKKNVSFGIHETEENAARQYDRALIIEKGRAAKTNFPLTDYEREADQYEAILLERCGASSGPQTRELAARLQLPLTDAHLGEEGPPPERSKGGRPRNSCAALIYAEALRKALRGN